ncbi:hypothetical protein [Halorubellus litoreus]|uniref:Halobacterial output domain-containing protein n=1 Tax=Halorubellus litoreus TaxID=755308 RepID=A0ABD5VHC3_9EURY
MTDAAMAVTERAVERFVEAYLVSLDAEIRKDGRRWTVSLPDDVDSELELEDTVLEIASDAKEVGDDALAIAPESAFVERLLDEAADRVPVGSLELTEEQWRIELPAWITAGPVDVVDRTFTPYYDRQALCALFHVGIETVSEYQTEELRSLAVDLNDEEERPGLAETYLELTDGEQRELAPGRPVDDTALKNALGTVRSNIENEVAPVVHETRERATRAAKVELEEYRKFVQQRRDELEGEIDNMSHRIEDATSTIDNASEQKDRVEALRKRKELQAELDDLRSELEELTTKLENDFPEKRRDIRDRHSLTVRIRPVTTTLVSYERGDLDLTLKTDDASATVSYSYAIGAGVMEEVTCEHCGTAVTTENPLTFDGNSRIGLDCCGE